MSDNHEHLEPEMAAQQAAAPDIDSQISEIVKLAHSQNPADKRAYDAAQDKLKDLVAQRAAQRADAPPPAAPPGRDPETADRIRSIMRLSHSGNPADRREYAERQDELRDLLSGKPTPAAATAPSAAVPDSYEIKWAGEEAPNFSEEDAALWEGALKDFQGAGFSQAQVDTVAAAFERAYHAGGEAAKAAEEARLDAAAAAGQQAVDELRKEFRDEYDDRIAETNAFIRKDFGRFLPSADGRKELFNLRLEDGRRLGDLAPLVRWLSDLARGRSA